MPHFLMLFLDGLGIGGQEPTNPFWAGDCAYLPLYRGGLLLPDNTPLKALPTDLGVAGLPQSATSQTSIFSGNNAPARLGKHAGSFPQRSLRQWLFQKNLLQETQRQGRLVRFLNAYPVYARYFTAKHLRLAADGRLWFSAAFPHEFRRRISVTTCMMLTIGQIPADENAIRAKRALYQDFSNLSLQRRGIILPRFSPVQAAAIMVQAAHECDLVLYEYFQTDVLGHRADIGECTRLARELDCLLRALLEQLDENCDTLLIISDHGNIEECGHRRHTTNPVPLLVWGQGSAGLRRSIHSLTDVLPAILSHFNHLAKNVAKDKMKS